MAFNDYWKIPKGAKKFFSPNQEKLLKEKYGKLYTLHTVCSIIILFIPLFLFFFFIPSNALAPTTQLENLFGAIGGILGFIGSLSIGIGLVNIFMCLIKQYLGHYVTVFSIIIGAILDGLAFFVFSLIK